MTVTDPRPTSAPLPVATIALVGPDLYRDIHKGIRAELFSVVGAAGSLDPSDPAARADLATHVGRVVTLLAEHAEHEDAAVQPRLESYLPALAARIARDHEEYDGHLPRLRDLAEQVGAGSGADVRRDVHHLYLELATFTGRYLEHQDVEERQVMPALEAAVGPDLTAQIHAEIIAAIPPEEMARSLSVMLPAMNVEDRTELLGGMQDNAPPEVFAGVWRLAVSVLDGPHAAELAARLGLGG